MQGNVGVKREFQRFMNRFFYSRDKSVENLSRMYYYLDDIISYAEDIQATIGTRLMEQDFVECYLEDIDKKVCYDDQLKVILIDAISPNEKKELNKERNFKAEQEQSQRALKG